MQHLPWYEVRRPVLQWRLALNTVVSDEFGLVLNTGGFGRPPVAEAGLFHVNRQRT
jgi:hypothetical protein